MNSNKENAPQPLDGVAADRKKAFDRLRKVINKNLPEGFSEIVGPGKVLWVVPIELYPSGYHCDPAKPLMLMCLSSEKNHIALHHMGIYGPGPLLSWFQTEWPNHCAKRLDMGKACIRFKKPEDIPFELIGELSSKLSPVQWVEAYERVKPNGR